ncbi:MAG: prolipoprotein diacylglyceryl transferase [Fimbriimonadaceae bacterium]|nr:prolipoprotein diacylglyceryl transferase [Fimbriimonadaceae bacterium]
MYPTLLRIGQFELPSFGVILVIAFFVGIAITIRRAPRFGITGDQVLDASFYMLIAGVLGARLFFIAQDWGYYREHINELLTLRFQGLTSFGGVFFGLFAVLFWCRRNGVDFRKYADMISPGFLVGHAIGRVGCLLNGCCFGGECPPNFPLGIRVAGDPHLHHPAQLYDSVMNVVGFGLLMLYERRRHGAGQVFGLMFILHGMARFIYEFWRAGSVQDVMQGKASSTYWGSLPITEAQAVALVLVITGGVLMAMFNDRAPAQQELIAS